MRFIMVIANLINYTSFFSNLLACSRSDSTTVALALRFNVCRVGCWVFYYWKAWIILLSYVCGLCSNSSCFCTCTFAGTFAGSSTLRRRGTAARRLQGASQVFCQLVLCPRVYRITRALLFEATPSHSSLRLHFFLPWAPRSGASTAWPAYDFMGAIRILHEYYCTRHLLLYVSRSQYSSSS